MAVHAVENGRHASGACLSAVCLPRLALAATAGSYTDAQAKAGAAVYSQECSVCHGSKLQGGAAPALVGPKFAASLKASYPTADKLYGFISSQMPVSNPGSLSKAQYEGALAFILAENGYPAGASALDAAHLDTVALLPYPAQNNEAATANASLEIQNIGISSRTVYGKLPEKSSVTTTDAMMNAPADHPADWLLHGHDYSNQRFSSLKDINDGNVKSLAAVALVQTGITSSFETTPIVVSGVMYATTPVVDSKMKIIALRADTGDIIWESTYNVGDFKICCGPVNRGVAVGYGNVYVTTLDDRLIALNAATGDVVWNVGVADPKVATRRRWRRRSTRARSSSAAPAANGRSADSWPLTTLPPGSRRGAGSRPIRSRLPAMRGSAAVAWYGRRRPSTVSAISSCFPPATPTLICMARTARGIIFIPTRSSR